MTGVLRAVSVEQRKKTINDGLLEERGPPVLYSTAKEWTVEYFLKGEPPVLRNRVSFYEHTLKGKASLSSKQR